MNEIHTLNPKILPFTCVNLSNYMMTEVGCKRKRERIESINEFKGKLV